MNVRGILLFLGLSYVLIALTTFIGVSQGYLALEKPNLFQYILLVVMMGIPALSAFAARLVFPDDRGPSWPIWPVPVAPAVVVTLAAPALFGVSCSGASLLGLTRPQWGLGSLLNRVKDQLSAPLTPGVESAAPVVALIAYPIISVLIGATLFSFIALGSELGWRGYLMPRLQPLGRLTASIVTGFCWGLWFLPLIYAWYLEADLPGVGGTMIRVIALGIALSILLSAIVIKTEHLGVAAMALGAFAGQDSGIWSHLFEQSSPPWTGTAGVINIAVWGIVGFAVWRWKLKKTE
jgi:hypothetical protein